MPPRHLLPAPILAAEDTAHCPGGQACWLTAWLAVTSTLLPPQAQGCGAAGDRKPNPQDSWGLT